MNQLKATVERYAFGVCSYLGRRMGLSTHRVRLYFIYASFVTLGSPILIYLFLAFWINIKKYLRKSRHPVWDM